MWCHTNTVKPQNFIAYEMDYKCFISVDTFLTSSSRQRTRRKNATWKERCKIICTQKSRVTWMRENIWEHNGVLAGLGEKLKKSFSPATFFSLEKSFSPSTFPRQTISLKNVCAGLQKWKRPPDANRCLLFPWRCHLWCLPSGWMTPLVDSWHQKGFGMPWTATCYHAF